ncbi:leucine-rich repeat, immunoglobulin-like domain and transmembrane domain-containing protein 3 [Lethenteron reissneri]|uniref:leucine-rich repeat, immunoglobulin-like domain and transmembrane domain-containing protein 3 n=1 Tax=Lethenteron reissneri TaxID=7753 RepID=UPI002AB7B84C|nr:leucine-rich repeat, immunoglobulin-like domain and transmembrane domain-containing protein 3 [Lethenteron reissneri]
MQASIRTQGMTSLLLFLLILPLLLLLVVVGGAGAACPAQCSCVYTGRGGERGTRSVLCTDPDMSTLPWDVPGDSVRLLVSRTLVRRVPSESFYYLPELRSLTLSCNRLSSISHGAFFNLKLLRELRLPGNVLTSFPWESLQETPSLRLLDLNGNRISSLPAESARFVSDLSTFDLSGNRLVTLPSDLLELWTLSAPTQAQVGEGLEGDGDPDRGPVTPISRTPVRLILALQENPWLCDCSLSRLLLLARSAIGGTGGQGQGQGQACPAPPRVILMDPDTACGGPGDLAGVPMRLAGIATPSPPGGCRPPRVQVSASRLTSALGSSLLLRCDASGTPTPTLEWARGDGRSLNATGSERRRLPDGGLPPSRSIGPLLVQPPWLGSVAELGRLGTPGCRLAPRPFLLWR